MQNGNAFSDTPTYVEEMDQVEVTITIHERFKIALEFQEGKHGPYFTRNWRWLETKANELCNVRMLLDCMEAGNR